MLIEKFPPKEWSYISAITELAFAEAPDKLLKHKLDALDSVMDAAKQYLNAHLPSTLVDAVVAKKTKMILEATSAKAIRELSQPPRPLYSGGRWKASENSVPEEELLLWAYVSPNAKLTSEAAARYEELYIAVFGRLP